MHRLEIDVNSAHMQRELLKRKGEMKMAETEILAENIDIDGSAKNAENDNANAETDASDVKQDNDVSAELAKAKADYAKLRETLGD